MRHTATVVFSVVLVYCIMCCVIPLRSQVILIGMRTDNVKQILQCSLEDTISDKKNDLSPDVFTTDTGKECDNISIAGYKGHYTIHFKNDTVVSFLWDISKKKLQLPSVAFLDIVDHLSVILGAPNYIHSNKKLETRTYGWLKDPFAGYFLRDSHHRIEFTFGFLYD